MEYYYLKETNDEISILNQIDFSLRFGGRFDHILDNFAIDNYSQLEELSLKKIKKIFFDNFVENWNKYKENWSDCIAIDFNSLSKEQQFNILHSTKILNSQQKKNRKRGNGEGSIYYSKKLNRWIGQYTYINKRKSVYGKTRKEVAEKITKALSDLNTGSYIESNKTKIYEFGKSMLDENFACNIIGEATYISNNFILNIIKASDIGRQQIQKATTKQIQDFLNTTTNYSNSTIDNIYGHLKRIFDEAIKRNYLIKNPMLNVKKPKSAKLDSKVEAFSFETQQELIKYFPKYNDGNIYFIALYTGMRIGEILALTIDDIDFKNKVIHINKTLTRNKDAKPIIGKKTKTYNSTRDIPITSLFEKNLKDAISKMVINENRLIFTNRNGNILRTSNINENFKKLYRKHINNTDIVHFHMFRHTYATRCIESGMSIVVLQKLLGHKNIETTLDTYTTVFNEFKKSEIEKSIEYMQKNI